MVSKPEDVNSVTQTVYFRTFIITLIDVTDSKIAQSNALDAPIGIKIECDKDKAGNLPTNFRCLLKRSEAMDLCVYAQQVAKRHNISLFLDSLKPTNEEFLERPSLRLREETNQSQTKSSAKVSAKAPTISGPERDFKAEIISRRGAFFALPAFFASDLVHGSW